jgi:hypothetical protein
MALTKNSPGCCCNQQSCTTTICTLSPCTTLDGTTPAATGVTVTVTNSSGFSFSGVTPSGAGGLGCLVFTIPASGLYTVATSGNQRYNDTSATHQLNCGGEFKIPLTAAGNFICSCFSTEPISPNLLITGGTGTATIPSNTFPQAFTLPASVPVLTPGDHTSCNGETLEDPCTTGSGSINVSFVFNSGEGGKSGCNDIQQSWLATTDCNANISDGGGSTALDFYAGTGIGPGENEEWGTPTECMGAIASADSVDPTYPSPQSVPIMFTVSFPVGPITGTNPPISSVTVTEAP